MYDLFDLKFIILQNSWKLSGYLEIFFQAEWLSWQTDFKALSWMRNQIPVTPY